ncbi:MAG TPA: VOC family protein [Longimicrobiales bacterium]
MVSLPAGTRPGVVRLRVRDVTRVGAFYRDVLGLLEQQCSPACVQFAAADGTTLLRLDHEPDAVPRPAGANGLYHFALLFPDRQSLGAAVRDVAAAGHRFQGFADHLVSEAAYLADPEGNGIELYRDRPREDWRWRAGSILMATDPLDTRALLDDADPAAAPPGRVPALRMGHIHLHTSDVARAAAFYADVLGFDITTRAYPGAAFLSAGGYHHHLGLNEWGSGRSAPDGATGLVEYELVVPDAATLTALVTATNADVNGGDARVRDPDGNTILLRVG